MPNTYNVNKKIDIIISVLVSALLCILTFWIIFVSMTKPMDNLLGGPMFVSSVLFGFLFIVFVYICVHFVSKNHILNNTLFYGGTVVYLGLLFFAGYFYRNPDAMHDVSIVKAAAENLTSNTMSDVIWYFESERQNFKITMILCYIKRVSSFFHCDEYCLELIIGIILIAVCIFSVRYLLGDHKEEYQCPILLFFVFFLPSFCYVQMFYTDMYSFGMGIIFIALMKAAIGFLERNKILSYVLSALAGIILSLAVAIKISAVIPVIAFSILGIIRLHRSYIPILFATVISMVLFSWLLSSCANQYELYRISETKKMPVIHWLAMGINGDGSWSDNEEYARAILELGTTKEKTEYALAYIHENIYELKNINHYISKTRADFACGTANIKQVVGISGEHHILQECFGYDGTYYWRMCQFCFSYMFGLWIVILFGAIANLFITIKRKSVDILLTASELSVVGMILFLMLWETSNRQLFNQIPSMILCAVCSINILLSFFESFLKKTTT